MWSEQIKLAEESQTDLTKRIQMGIYILAVQNTLKQKGDTKTNTTSYTMNTKEQDN